MDHRGFWNLVRSRWLVIVAFALLGTIGAAAFSLTRVAEYSAQAELFVASVGSDSSSDLAQGSNYSQQQARNYSAVATRQVVLGPVIEALGLDTTTRELATRVSASVPLNTSLITITVQDTSPERAAATANSVATSLVNNVIRLVPKRTDGTTPVRLETIQSATAPTVAAGASRAVLLTAGLLLGLVAGIAFVVLREFGSARVRTADQIRQIDELALLGSVVHDRAARKNPLLPASRAGSARFEEFRQIRTNLRLLNSNDHRIVVVTSAIPGEGRSLTAANLAIAIASAGRSVCLVEGDLRRPSLAGYFGVGVETGLADVLAGKADVDSALVVIDEHLTLLPAGAPAPNPSELLGSTRTIDVVDGLADRFDVVLIDSPPLLPVTDAAILATAFGGAVMVVGAGRVEVRELRAAVDTLDAAEVSILGVVLNDVPARIAGRFRGAYAHESRSTTKDSKSAPNAPSEDASDTSQTVLTTETPRATIPPPVSARSGDRAVANGADRTTPELDEREEAGFATQRRSRYVIAAFRDRDSA